MDSSNQMFATLNRITSSIVSTANNGFGRVLELTGSFNDRTSLLLPDAPGSVTEQEGATTSPPPSPAAGGASTAPVTATHAAFDIEAATAPETLAAASVQGQQAEPTAQDAEAKRVAKSVQTVCLFAASTSLVLFVNLPPKPGAAAAAAEHGGAVLYIADIAFICLALFTSLCLSMYSIVARPGADDPAAVAGVQKRAMVMAVALVLVSFTLRVCMMLPAAALESAWLVFVLLAGAVAVYLALAWRFGGAAARGAETATSGSGGGRAGAADRV